MIAHGVPHVSDQPPDIGANLRAIRLEKGLSLAVLAQKSGISDATLSRVETGKTLVSAHNLYTLGKALGVDITAFYAPEARPLRSGVRAITRQGQGHSVETDRFAALILAGDLSHKDMHPSINVITATHLDEVGGMTGHAGEEFLYVLEGHLVLHSAHYAPVLLEQGDSIYFDGSMPHAYLAAKGTKARILVVNATPSSLTTGNLP